MNQLPIWKRVHLVALSAILVASLAACGSSSKSSSKTSGTGSATTVSQPISVTIGVSGGENAASLELYYAAANGIFTKNGLNVTIAQLSSDTLGLQGLQSNTYPVVFVGASSTAEAMSAGASVKIFDVPYPLLDYFFVAKNSISSLAGMQGKTLGVSSPSSQSALIPLAMLKQAGVDTSKVNVVKIGYDSQRAQALLAGTIDGAVMNPFVTAGIRTQPSVHVITNTSDQQFMNSVLVTSPSVISSNPQLLQRLTTAVIEACREMWTNQQAFVSFADSQSALPTGTGQTVWSLLHQSTTPFYGVDGGLLQSYWTGMNNTLIASGQMKNPIDWNTAVDPTFVNSAVKSLGKFSG